jgi:hypothetical protein
MKGELRVNQETNINKETIHLKLSGFTVNW